MGVPLSQMAAVTCYVLVVALPDAKTARDAAGTLDLSNERGVRMARALSSRSAETVDEVGALELLD